jgi:hypothetical protein
VCVDWLLYAISIKRLYELLKSDLANLVATFNPILGNNPHDLIIGCGALDNGYSIIVDFRF